jgi:hypothetical protein
LSHDPSEQGSLSSCDLASGWAGGPLSAAEPLRSGERAIER